MKRIKTVALAALSLVLMSGRWQTDFEKARKEAKASHKLILLTFSGSDWCLPCIRMEKEVFNKDEFLQFADSRLVMVNADFPRQNRNKDKSLVKQNEALAEKYDKQGHFPLTVLLDADGKVLKSWDGYDGSTPEAFISQLKAFQ